VTTGLRESARSAWSADRSRDPLVAVARSFLEDRPLRHAMRAIAALDWDATIARAEQERLAPILYVALRGGAAPAPVLARLRESWMGAECQHLRAGRQLRAIVAALGERGVPTIILNGPALAIDYYPDPALRPFADLDLLVRRRDRLDAVQVLLELGYTDVPGRSLDTLPAAYLSPPPGGAALPVDVHWECVGGPRASELAAEEIWSRAVPAPSWGDSARTLAPEDLLLYLAATFAVHHTLAGALWQLDLALVLRRHRSTLDWDAITARARRWSAAGAVYFALRAVADQLGVSAPTPAMNRLRPDELRVSVMDRLQRSGPDGALLDYLLGVVMLDRYSDMVRSLTAGLVPPPGWLRSRYDSRSLVAAYLTHYGRVARTLARAML
jgi:hypothetical protein